MHRVRLLVLPSLLFALLRPGPAAAQAAGVPGQDWPPEPPASAPPTQVYPPAAAPPAAAPLAAAPQPPAPAGAPAPAPAPAPAAQGQWVYTQQYGWVWMTYDDEHVYAPPSGSGEPLEYVYYPSHGWTWIVAPWVWGVGPWPYFGTHPPSLFAWYRHGWWRTPARWHYRPVAVRAGVAVRGIRPAPARVRVEHRQEHR